MMHATTRLQHTQTNMTHILPSLPVTNTNVDIANIPVLISMCTAQLQAKGSQRREAGCSAVDSSEVRLDYKLQR